MQKDIQLQLSLEEVNLVLEALGNLPFARVYSLVGKLQSQASEQLPKTNPHPGGPGADAPRPGPAGSPGKA